MHTPAQIRTDTQTDIHAYLAMHAHTHLQSEADEGDRKESGMLAQCVALNKVHKKVYTHTHTHTALNKVHKKVRKHNPTLPSLVQGLVESLLGVYVRPAHPWFAFFAFKSWFKSC